MTKKTPFASDPLHSHFGHGAKSTEAIDFVQNITHKLPEGTPTLAEEILNKLKTHYDDPLPANSKITAGDLISAFMKWKEKTSTFPQGTHLGHYKVWLKDYAGIDRDENNNPVKTHDHLSAKHFLTSNQQN